MNRFERDALDRHITGNWGGDSVEDEPDEPVEGDLITSDHIKVYQYGKCVLETNPDSFDQDAQKYMDTQKFWPSVWFISDHGNAHLITLGVIT